MAVVTVVILVSLILTNVVGASNSLGVHDDTVNGRVTLETDAIKAVWHYKTLSSESNNQSGGSLYELYYKATDPGLEKNLVSFANRPNWGTGRSYTMVGVSGIGSSGMYATNQPPTTGTYSSDDQISDNNLSGELISHSVETDASGNTVLNFSFKVKSQSTNSTHQPAGGYWYRVDKKWVIEPDSTIHLEVTRTILNTGYFSEPAVRMNWSGETNVGWTRYEKYGREWSSQSNPLYTRTIADISQEQGSCFNYYNQFQPDWIALTGSESAPSVRVVSDNDGRGFAGSGSYALGASFWGPSGSSLEQCAYRQGISSYGVGWYAWWGGNPPGSPRYKQLTAGTTWKDTFRIELTEGSIANAVSISNVSLNGLVQGHATFSWATDVTADTQLERRVAGGSWGAVSTDATRTLNHSVVIEDYDANAYEYLLKSKDANGNIAIRQLSTHSSNGTSILLGQRSSYWKSYTDFQDGNLTVDLFIKNNGLSAVSDLYINTINSSSRVTVVTPLPIAIGTVQGNTQVPFAVTYHVPQGVTLFRSMLTGVATGPDGDSIFLP